MRGVLARYRLIALAVDAVVADSVLTGYVAILSNVRLTLVN